MSFHTNDSPIGKGMRNIIFHETKRERKYYEGKKQKALRYLDHTKRDYHKYGYVLDHKWKELRRLVNDI